MRRRHQTPKIVLPAPLAKPKYVESPPSGSKSAAGEFGTENQNASPTSPSTPKTKSVGRPENKVLTEIGLRKYYTDSSDEEHSPSSSTKSHSPTAQVDRIEGTPRKLKTFPITSCLSSLSPTVCVCILSGATVISNCLEAE